MRLKRKIMLSWKLSPQLAVISMLWLAACSSAPAPEVLTKVQVEHVTVPTALLTVPAEPPVPTGRMQSAAANYIVSLKINDDECHTDVAAVAASQK